MIQPLIGYNFIRGRLLIKDLRYMLDVYGITDNKELWQRIINKAPMPILKQLAKSLALVNSSNSVKWTVVSPYFLASEYGLLKSYQYFLKNMPYRNPGTRNGQTALHIAADNGQLEICKLILSVIEDKNPSNKKEGATPLHLAAAQGHLEVCRLFLNR